MTDLGLGLLILIFLVGIALVIYGFLKKQDKRSVFYIFNLIGSILIAFSPIFYISLRDNGLEGLVYIVSFGLAIGTFLLFIVVYELRRFYLKTMTRFRATLFAFMLPLLVLLVLFILLLFSRLAPVLF